MTTPNNGGAAFPSANAVTVGDCRTNGHPGMSLRDKFADTILPACYAEYFAGLGRGEYRCEPDWREGIAIEAYRIADAMLAARGAP